MPSVLWPQMPMARTIHLNHLNYESRGTVCMCSIYRRCAAYSEVSAGEKSSCVGRASRTARRERTSWFRRSPQLHGAEAILRC
jgi:hypothetical protein